MTKLAIFSAVAASAGGTSCGHGKPRASRLEEFRDRRSGCDGRSVAKRTDATKQPKRRRQNLRSVAAQDRSWQVETQARLAGFRSERPRRIPRQKQSASVWVSSSAAVRCFTKGARNHHVHGIAGGTRSTCRKCGLVHEKVAADNIFFGSVRCARPGSFAWKPASGSTSYAQVSDEMKKTHVVIAEEFGLCNLLQMGRPPTCCTSWAPARASMI
jgi:hypothetical protein